MDGNVDAERTKVVHDLLYTGCVSEAGLIERNKLLTHLENGTGTELKTDGRVAVLRISECTEPRVVSEAGASERTNFLRRLGPSLRTELIRSNFISLAYNYTLPRIFRARPRCPQILGTFRPQCVGPGG